MGYLNDQPKLYCPRLPSYNQGAKITGSYYSYKANEDLIKKLVYENGAAVVTVKSQVHSKSTREVFLLVVLLTLKLIMPSLLLVMVEKEAQTTGSSRTAGERAGVKMDSSD